MLFCAVRSGLSHSQQITLNHSDITDFYFTVSRKIWLSHNWIQDSNANAFVIVLLLNRCFAIMFKMISSLFSLPFRLECCVHFNPCQPCLLSVYCDLTKRRFLWQLRGLEQLSIGYRHGLRYVDTKPQTSTCTWTHFTITSAQTFLFIRDFFFSLYNLAEFIHVNQKHNQLSAQKPYFRAGNAPLETLPWKRFPPVKKLISTQFEECTLGCIEKNESFSSWRLKSGKELRKVRDHWGISQD